MAEKIESNEKKNETKTATKKIATGHTKKVVEKRSSSVAGKSANKKELEKKNIAKKVETAELKKTKNNPSEKANTKSSRNKKETVSKANLENEKIEGKATSKMEEEKVLEKNKETKDTKKVKTKKSNNVDNQEKKKPSESKKQVEKQKDKKQSQKDEKRQIQEQNRKDEKKQDKKQNKNKKEDKEENKQESKQLQTKETNEIAEAVKQEMKANKKMPIEQLSKIHTRVFQNICLAVVMMFYLNFIILGFINIENAVFVTDLKVFSLAILLIAIGVFEYAYKKDSGRHAIHGIEILVLALVTIAMIYLNLMWADKFIYITAFMTYLFAIYYVVKAVIVYYKMKKEYFMNEMKEIIKK